MIAYSDPTNWDNWTLSHMEQTEKYTFQKMSETKFFVKNDDSVVSFLTLLGMKKLDIPICFDSGIIDFWFYFEENGKGFHVFVTRYPNVAMSIFELLNEKLVPFLQNRFVDFNTKDEMCYLINEILSVFITKQ